jgi:hypothetical protein
MADVKSFFGVLSAASALTPTHPRPPFCGAELLRPLNHCLVQIIKKSGSLCLTFDFGVVSNGGVHRSPRGLQIFLIRTETLFTTFTVLPSTPALTVTADLVLTPPV